MRPRPHSAGDHDPTIADGFDHGIVPLFRGGIGPMFPVVGVTMTFPSELSVIGFWAEFPIRDPVVRDRENRIILCPPKMG